jgi:hypothetical protein
VNMILWKTWGLVLLAIILSLFFYESVKS